MNIVDTALDGVKIIEPEVFGDHRGYFFESFNQRAFEAAIGRTVDFVQDNHSRSTRGVLRGLHYQLAPHAQGKLVRVVHGEIFDVAVDVRRGASSFGQWVGVRLSADNHRQLWIPEGYAHAFLVLSESAECLYKTTDYWFRDMERIIAWNDPDIGIQWPQAGAPILSRKDGQGLPLRRSDGI